MISQNIKCTFLFLYTDNSIILKIEYLKLFALKEKFKITLIYICKLSVVYVLNEIINTCNWRIVDMYPLNTANFLLIVK